MEEILEKIATMLISGNEAEVKTLTQEALNNGVGAKEILDKGLLAGMDVVGKRFKADEMFIPEVLLCARCMHGAMQILQPLLTEADAKGVGKFVIGTVEGDLHDIGKNLVAMMLQGAGFEVIDLGINLKPQVFVDAVKEHKPDIIGMSALLTTTMPKMAETIKALQEAGLRDKVKIMAGGAPVTRNFVKEIGGDAYGESAAIAAEKAKELLADV
jgi:5-methyltetrahydrofolate--homocysteine methyltransferase